MKNSLLDELNTVAKYDKIDLEILYEEYEYELQILNTKFSSRKYQKDALGRFIFYMDKNDIKTKPMHLLFNLATGSGKTLLMAWILGYLKEKHNYKHVIFLVNSVEIVNKTIMNFTDKLNKKYLFNSNLPFDIKIVENFSALMPHQVGMKFTTIQGLASELDNPGNGTLTYQDFRDNKILIFADESHHLNADTKKGNKEETQKKSWEDLVNKALNNNLANILLEFTATIPNDDNVHAKYDDKVIAKYALKQYREDKYSKDVDLIKLHKKTLIEKEQKLFLKDRILLACIMSQYKTDLFRELKESITAKILFKSNKTDDNLKNLEFFKDVILNLKTTDIKCLFNILKPDFNKKEFVHFKDAFEYYEQDGFVNLVNTCKEVFTFNNEIKGRAISKGSVRIVDTKNKEDTGFLKDLDSTNSIVRVIFAVDMLNEGWDVLSLFDIVRLYESRSNVKETDDTKQKKTKAGPQTVKEAQLIGRGARYCPFSWKDLEKDKRKFDDYNKEERKFSVLERLHYYSADDSLYITELKGQLMDDGIIADKEVQEKVIKLKQLFKNKIKAANIKIYLNTINSNTIKVDKKNINIRNNLTIFYDENLSVSNIIDVDTKTTSHSYDLILNQISKNILFKALVLQRIDFKWVKDNINGFDGLLDFIKEVSNQKFMMKTTLSRDKILDNNKLILLPKVQLNIAVKVIKKIKDMISKNKKELTANTFISFDILDIIKDEKTLRISDSNSRIEISSAKDWFSHDKLIGTNYEISLYNVIETYFENHDSKIDNLNIKEFFLLRNEQDFKIFNKDGKAFEPDFVLFLLLQDMEVKMCQIFIEPKGEHLQDYDRWKEDFLLSIDFEDNKNCAKVFGLDFYTPNINKQVYFENIKNKI